MSDSVNWSKIKTLLPYIKPYYPKMGVAIGSGILNHFFAIASSALAAYIVGKAVTGQSVEEIMGYIWLLGAFVITRALMVYSEMYVVHAVAYSILCDYRNLLYQAIDRIAPGYLIKKRSGDIASSAMADVEVLEWFYAHTVGAYIIAFVVPIIYLGILAYIHWLLPLALLPILVLVATIPFWFSEKAVQQGKETRRKLGVVNAEVVDGVQGMREIVAFGRGKTYLEKLDKHTLDLAESQVADGKRLGLEGGLINGFMSIGMVTILLLASYLVTQNLIEPAFIPVIIILSVYIFTPIVDVSGTARNLGTISAAAERVFTILNAPAPVEERVTKGPENPLTPHIKFEGVTFSYEDDDEKDVATDDNNNNVLDQVTFQVMPGEKVALVGHSGAGKTTCANLLLRFWDVNDGRITIGNQDIRELPLKTLRELIGVVSQDVYLFNMTIRDNIRLGRPDATDAEVEAAAKQALAHEFLLELPNGYDTNVGERGVQLSGGQRQRIAIARALIKKSPILLMDEAVSNLDAENEKAVEKAIDELQKDCTSLVIAHRLSTIKSADRIVVLDQGKVAEIGTHAELIARDGVYYKLISS